MQVHFVSPGLEVSNLWHPAITLQVNPTSYFSTCSKREFGNTYDSERFGILVSSDNSSTQPISILTSNLVIYNVTTFSRVRGV